MKKRAFSAISLVMVILLLVACGGPAGEQDGGDGLRIGIIYLTMEHPYYQAHAAHTRDIAEEMGFELIELDGRLDQALMADHIENLIAMGVDGIIYCLLEATAASADINLAQEAGIPIITFAIKHDPATASAPFVGLDEFDAGSLGGVEAGRIFLEQFPGETAEVILVGQPGIPATIARADGFFAGFSSVVADANLITHIDGGGVMDQAMSATEDILQANPQANVFFGANGDMGLGALAALQAHGRGTIDTEIVISHDGSEPEVLEIVDPNSALVVANANRPMDLARRCVEILFEIIEGQREMTDSSDIYVSTAVLTGEDINELQEFISVQYLSTTVLEGAD